MAVRVIAGNNENIASTETYVSSNLPTSVRVYLPKINDGTGGTIAVNKEIRIESLGSGSIEVVTLGGSRGAICCPANESSCQGENDDLAHGSPFLLLHRMSDAGGLRRRSEPGDRPARARRGRAARRAVRWHHGALRLHWRRPVRDHVPEHPAVGEADRRKG